MSTFPLRVSSGAKSAATRPCSWPTTLKDLSMSSVSSYLINLCPYHSLLGRFFSLELAKTTQWWNAHARVFCWLVGSMEHCHHHQITKRTTEKDSRKQNAQYFRWTSLVKHFSSSFLLLLSRSFETGEGKKVDICGFLQLLFSLPTTVKKIFAISLSFAPCRSSR